MENTVLSADFDFFAPKRPQKGPPVEGNGPLTAPNRMQENLNGKYNKKVNVAHMVAGVQPESYSLTLKIHMETKMGESMSVVGSLNELGRWKNFNVAKMKWTEGHIWVINMVLPKQSTVFMYKYVKVVNGNAGSWEQGYNRVADLLSLH
jgi:hypothetical protein